MKHSISDSSAVNHLVHSSIKNQREEQLEQWMSLGIDYCSKQLENKSQQEVFSLFLLLILQYRTHKADECKKQFLILFLQQVVSVLDIHQSREK